MVKDAHRDFNKHKHNESKLTAPGTKANFATSPTAPYLSALLQNRGYDVKLKQMVDTARAKVGIDFVEASDEEIADLSNRPAI
jgi:ADA HAT complex component 1